MDLGQLIAEARGDKSYERLARDSGVTRSTIHRLATDPPPHANTADTPTIRGLAVALRRKVRLVWLAQGESLGLSVWEPSDDLEARAVDGLDLLTPEDWNVANEVLAYMVARRRAERDAADAADAAAAAEAEPPARPARARKGATTGTAARAPRRPRASG